MIDKRNRTREQARVAARIEKNVDPRLRMVRNASETASPAITEGKAAR
jgi:hypothetical protein